jgi:hypothetical protein
MKISGMSAVSDFLDDMIVYRNLAPVDSRLPSLDTLRPELGLPAHVIPRKNEADYARVVVGILKHARQLTTPGAHIKRVLFLGDTRLLDSTAFANICAAGGWPGIAFIGSENKSAPKVELETIPGGQSLFLSNRWAALDEQLAAGLGMPSFPAYCAEQGLLIDQGTVLLIDLDKTTLGARGRNAATIDNARVQAVYETVAELLGCLFDPQGFRSAYDLLVQPEFHPFTEDNQDNVAYVCLILGSGLYQLAEIVREVRARELRSFHQFIEIVEGRKAELPAALKTIHNEIFANVQAGDPTPFKPFRYNEYRITIARMGCQPDSASLETLLAEEIVITREVRDLALACKAKGALVFGLSDKPDEASLPGPDLAAQGFLPLHRKITHVLGE